MTETEGVAGSFVTPEGIREVECTELSVSTLEPWFEGWGYWSRRRSQASF